MLAATALALTLVAAHPIEYRGEADDYAQCGFYHWSLVENAREAGDYDKAHLHLVHLSNLARSLALHMRISLDGAHAILRRTGELFARKHGNDIPIVANAGRSCVRLEQNLDF